MLPTPRFHLDECLTVRIAKGLRLRDRDCTTSKDAGLISASDTQQWEFAKQEGRIIITVDQDFLRIATDDNDHPGLIYWTRSGEEHFGQLVKHINELCSGTLAEEFRGAVYYL